MSKAIPMAIVSALRADTDMVLTEFGIECVSYVMQNRHEMLVQSVYAIPEDVEIVKYTCNVWINWHPTKHILSKLGLYIEDEDLPILVRFPTEAVNSEGATVPINITPRSWFRIDLQHVPQDIQVPEEFEITQKAVSEIHDIAITRIWKAVPRRVDMFKSEDQVL